MTDLFGPTNVARARAELTASGYKGERVVLLAPTDNPVSGPAANVADDLFRRIGLSVVTQAMGLGTMNVRRNSREPVDKGGWSCFPTSFAGLDILNPAVSLVARGNGAAGYYGWPTSARMESLRSDWMDAQDDDARKRLASQIQLEIWQEATFAPLGQIFQPQATPTVLSRILPGFVKFYNVDKTI